MASTLSELAATTGLDPDSLVVVDHPRFGPQIVRTGTTDRPTYNQVFMREDYRFDYPHDPKTIVDLGANVGYSAVYLQRIFPDARVVAVEPDLTNSLVAEANVRLLGRGADIPIVQSAVWHRRTSLKITNPTGNAWAFRVNEAEPGSEGSFEAVTMSDLMVQHELDVIDLLKIDIEAGERFLFSASTEWLDRVNMLVIELHDRFTPGCRKPVVDALDTHFGEYDEIEHGENTLFVRRDLVGSIGV